MTNAGQAFSRFLHQKLSQPTDDLNAPVETHTDCKTYWGQFVPMRPQEALAYNLRSEQLGVKIVLRNNPPVKGGDRLKDQRDGTVYEVTGPPLWERHQITVYATSGVSP